MKRESKFIIMTLILLCGIAVQYMFISVILNDNIVFKFWKEIILIILLVDTIIIQLSKKRKFMIKKYYIEILLILFIINLFAIGIFINKDLGTTIFVMRIYIFPFIIYYIAKYNRRFTKNSVGKIIKCLFLFYTVVAIWGIFQALVLGDDFLINLGYPLKYAGRLRDSYYFGGFGDFQRVVSTFANTNVFGAVTGMLIFIVALNTFFIENFKWKKQCLVTLIVAFIFTFSRSNWIAMVLISLLLILRNREIILMLKNKKLQKNALILIVVILIGVFIYDKVKNINIFGVVHKYIVDTITLKDTSAAGRIGIWLDGVSTFIQNPFGIGLGKVGMVSAKLTGKIYVTGESSYIAILLDSGIQGFILYFTALFLNFYYTFRNNNVNAARYLRTVRYLIIYLSVMFIFSNHIYDLEMMIFALFFIGLGQNKKFLKSLG